MKSQISRIQKIRKLLVWAGMSLKRLLCGTRLWRLKTLWVRAAQEVWARGRESVIASAPARRLWKLRVFRFYEVRKPLVWAGVLLLAVLLAGVLPVVSADNGAVPQVEAEELSGQALDSENEQESFSDSVTINVQDGDIAQVLNAFSRQTGRSIVIAPEVKGNVTLRLKDIPWQDALQVLLKPYGYGYQMVGDTIVVSGLEKLRQVETVEPIISEIFILRYLDANDVKPLIESQLSSRGKVSVLKIQGQKGWEFETGRQEGAAAGGKRERIGGAKQSTRSKTLLVSDIDAVLKKVKEMLEKVDNIPIQVRIETRFVEVSEDLLRDIGLDFGTGARGAETAEVEPVPVEDSTRLFGMGAKGGGSSVEPAAFQPSSTDLSGTRPFNAGMTFLFQQLNEVQFQVLLHMLEEDADANVLSAPRIVTLDNQEASIMVGEKFPIIKQEVSGDNASVSTSLDYYEDVGIQLNVVPQVCDDKYINMLVHPAVTTQIGTAEGRTGTASDIPLTPYPILSTREADTQVLLKSGQTIVIGGLLEEQKGKTEFKVPFLGDIPLLGMLFRRRTHQNDKLDLLIFITATIVERPTDMNVPLPEKAERNIGKMWDINAAPESAAADDE